MEKDIVSTYHPIIEFAYFVCMIVFSVIFLHPLMLAASFAGAFAYAVFLDGKKTVKLWAKWLLPLTAAVTVINPLFNHYGETILGYFRGNPITEESIIYGVISGVMFSTVILWCRCYNAVMSSDKFMYIFGRVTPHLSLVFSMVLRFIPKFRRQIAVVSKAQECIGREASSGSIVKRARRGMKILSIMTTWALEDAVGTSDSMRSRGYGLGGRTAYSIYRFDTRDAVIAAVMFAAAAAVIAGGVLGINTLTYYPAVKYAEISASTAPVYAAYVLLCFGPVILNGREAVKWRHLQSRI
jgi:Cobalt transport protein.